MGKKKKFSSLFIGASCAILFIFLDPLKVTDPSELGFNPDRFSFRDYRGEGELAAAFIKLFPVGTPKEFVDRVLVASGKANCGHDDNQPQIWHCWETSNFSFSGPPQHVIIYSNDMTVLNILPYGGKEIFSESVKYRDISNLEKTNNHNAN